MRLDDAPSVFEWIELVLASHRNTQRLERVKDSHRRGVLGQYFRQSLIAVRCNTPILPIGDMLPYMLKFARVEHSLFECRP